MKQDNQRFLNLILVSAFAPLTVFLIFLSKIDQKKLGWISFLNVDCNSEVYAKKNCVSQKSAKILLFLYESFIYVCRGSYSFYLLVVYMYYGQSLLLSIDKNIGSNMFIFAFFPTVMTSVLSVSVYYMTITKVISIFVLFNFFQGEKLDKLSKDLIRFIGHHQKPGRRFIARHLGEFQLFLEDFRHSQEFFNFTNQTFLVANFMTLVWYPHVILMSTDLSVDFLIISYLLNVGFVVLPLFCSASFFRYKVSAHRQTLTLINL